MKKLAIVSLLFLSFSASAQDKLDFAQCLGQLTYDMVDDQPSLDTRNKIQSIYKKMADLDVNVMGDIHEDAIIFSKSLEWTSMLNDKIPYQHIKEVGQKSCEKVLQ